MLPDKKHAPEPTCQKSSPCFLNIESHHVMEMYKVCLAASLAHPQQSKSE